jgi:3-keto-disaccharide hydrolase
MDGRSLPANRLIVLGVVAACALACGTPPARSQPGAIMIPIEKMIVGVAPADFEFARTGQGAVGQWVVVGDSSAASKHAIEQSNTDRTDYRFPLAIYQPTTAKNVEVSIRFKPVAGKVDQAGGIAVRLTSPDDYYLVRANALEDNVRFYRIVKSRRQQLATANVKVAPGVWHTLGIKAENDRFTVSFDGKQLHSTTDKTFPAAGRIALWTKSDSVTRFDQINIQVLP